MTKNHTKTLAYSAGYITKKKIDDYENICSVNPLYLIIANVSGYIDEKDLHTLYMNIDHASGYIKEKSVNKYLVFDPIDENKELLEIVMFGMELKTKSTLKFHNIKVNKKEFTCLKKRLT